MDLPPQSNRKPRSWYTGCGVCRSCLFLPNFEGHDNFGSHDNFPTLRSSLSDLRLRVKVYRTNEIVDKTIDYMVARTVENDNLPTIQTNARLSRRNGWSQHAGLVLDQRGRPAIELYFDFFSEYFFGGTLSRSDNVNLEWADHQMMPEEECVGATSYSWSQSGLFEDAVRIQLREPDKNDHGTPNASLNILRTLLHEMTHAMIVLFSCSCCCSINHQGVEGHGASFMRLARAIEFHAQKAFPRVGEWDLGLKVSFGNERYRLYELCAQQRLYKKTMLRELEWLNRYTSWGLLRGWA